MLVGGQHFGEDNSMSKGVQAVDVLLRAIAC